MSLSVSNLSTILSTINSTVAGGIASLTPAQLASTITGLSTVLGPSQAEQTLGKDLEVYAKFAVPGFAGNTQDQQFAMNIEISVAGITGLPSNVTNLLPAVWAAKDEATLQAAIGAVKNAAGL